MSSFMNAPTGIRTQTAYAKTTLRKRASLTWLRAIPDCYQLGTSRCIRNLVVTALASYAPIYEYQTHFF